MLSRGPLYIPLQISSHFKFPFQIFFLSLSTDFSLFISHSNLTQSILQPMRSASTLSSSHQCRYNLLPTFHTHFMRPTTLNSQTAIYESIDTYNGHSLKINWNQFVILINLIKSIGTYNGPTFLILEILCNAPTS